MQPDELSPAVKRLRRAVIVMGYMLVIGTIALFIATYFKFFYNKPEEQNGIYTVTSKQNPISNCTIKPGANIKADGKIISSNINGNLLTLITSNPSKAGQQVIIFDLCKGEITSKINVAN